MDDVLREHVGGGSVEVVLLVEAEVVGEDLEHVLAALGDVVVQQLDAVDAHEAEEGVVALLEVALAVT